MLPLQPPTIDHEATYVLSRERFSDQGYKDRLALGQARVVELGVEYHARAQASDLSTFEELDDVQPYILPGDMPRLYKQGFLRKNSDARKIYESLRVSSPYRVCPFCLHRNVKTLDHYLPKDAFAAFAVLPLNLIPCCRDCNSEKLEFAAVDRAESILHPYYDHIDGSMWLGCELVLEGSIWNPRFYVSAANVDEVLRDRLISHMTVLDLFNLYDVEGAREINECRLQIQRSYQNGGPPAVRQLCLEMGASRAILAANYWRAVLWNSAATVDDFCDAMWSL